MNFNYLDTRQREMALVQAMPLVKWVPEEIVDTWTCYRDAVVWAWANRPFRGQDEPEDQAEFSRRVGIRPCHFSRCVKADSAQPMNLSPDHGPFFQQWTGWRALIQYEMKIHRVTAMEKIMAGSKAKVA